MRLFILFTILVSSLSMFCEAEEYRFNREEGGIGLMDVVVDSKGVGTSIRFDDSSDPAAMQVWSALMDAEINGTSGPCKYNGVFFDQPIVFTGEFTSGVLQTKAVENGADSEPYRIFKVTGLKIGFPFTRQRYPQDSRDAERTVLETHFGFETLLPKGVELDGKQLDLSPFRNPAPSGLNSVPSTEPGGEPGRPGHSPTRPESKPEDPQKGAGAKVRATRIERRALYSFQLLGVPATESKKWNGDYAIGDDGKIRLPMIEGIKVEALTLPEAQGLIEASLKEHGIFTAPKVRLEPAKNG